VGGTGGKGGCGGCLAGSLGGGGKGDCCGIIRNGGGGGGGAGFKGGGGGNHGHLEFHAQAIAGGGGGGGGGTSLVAPSPLSVQYFVSTRSRDGVVTLSWSVNGIGPLLPLRPPVHVTTMSASRVASKGLGVSIDPGASKINTELYLRVAGHLKRVASASATASPDNFTRLTLMPSRSIRRYLRDAGVAQGQLRVVYPGGSTLAQPLALN
jgi:hypothetical protein